MKCCDVVFVRNLVPYVYALITVGSGENKFAVVTGFILSVRVSEITECVETTAGVRYTAIKKLTLFRDIKFLRNYKFCPYVYTLIASQ